MKSERPCEPSGSAAQQTPEEKRKHRKGFLDIHPGLLLCEAGKHGQTGVLTGIFGVLCVCAAGEGGRESRAVSLKSVQKLFLQRRPENRLCQQDQCQADSERCGHPARLTLLGGGGGGRWSGGYVLFQWGLTGAKEDGGRIMRKEGRTGETAPEK